MKRLEHSGSSDQSDDIVDAEFEEGDDTRRTIRSPSTRPPRPPAPQQAPTLAEWWRHKGFLTKTLIAFVPLLFLAMCVAAVGDAPDTAVETSNVEQEAGLLENAADQAQLTTEAVEPDRAANGPPTCAAIEGEISKLFAKTIGKAVLEINNSRSETVDDFPQCHGSALTEAGTIFITYGIQLSPKGQPYFYVRPTLDLVIPPGMENAPMPRYAAPADARPDEAAPTPKAAETPSAMPSPTASPTPAASPQPTDDDVYAPHP